MDEECLRWWWNELCLTLPQNRKESKSHQGFVTKCIMLKWIGRGTSMKLNTMYDGRLVWFGRACWSLAFMLLRTEINLYGNAIFQIPVQLIALYTSPDQPLTRKQSRDKVNPKDSYHTTPNPDRTFSYAFACNFLIDIRLNCVLCSFCFCSCILLISVFTISVTK